MALPPEASEALDDSTSPERLTEIAETFPELQSLVAVNPSCPERTREWILASNRSAAELYRTTRHDAQAASADPAEVAEQAHAGGDAWGLGSDRPADTDAESVDTASADAAGTTDAGADGASIDSVATPADEPETAPVDAVDLEATQAMGAVSDEPEPSSTPEPPVVAEPPALAEPAEPTASPGETTGEPATAPVGDEGPTDVLPVAEDHPTEVLPGHAASSDGPVSATPTAEHVVPLPEQSSRATEPSSGDADERPSLPRVTGYLDAVSPAPAERSADPSPTSASYASPAAYGSAGSSPSPARPAAAGVAGATSPAAYASPAAYGSPPQPPAGGTGPSSGSGDGTGRRTLLWVGLGCLALAIVLVVVVGIGAYLVRGGGGDDTGGATTPTTSASEAPTESASSTSESPSSSSSEALVSPAPDDAQDLTSVRSPTGNITCELGDDSVGCSIGTWSFPPSGNCTDTASPFSIAVAGDRPTVDCGSSYGTPGSGGGTELPYGSTAANGEVACRSESSGMTCWNQRTGHGFTVSKSSSDTF